MDKDILMEILESREARLRKQLELIEKYKASLISFTLNIPGRKKDGDLYRRIHREGLRAIEEKLEKEQIKIYHKEEGQKSTGPEAFIVVNMDPMDLKRMTSQIEKDHVLGRIFDIDVFDSRARQISRTDLGLEPRTCLLCNKEVRLCMREKNHSYEELIEEIEKLGRRYFHL